jgi:hypothetical protein
MFAFNIIIAKQGTSVAIILEVRKLKVATHNL